VMARSMNLKGKDIKGTRSVTTICRYVPLCTTIMLLALEGLGGRLEGGSWPRAIEGKKLLEVIITCS
jgi:hypothetical protein